MVSACSLFLWAGTLPFFCDAENQNILELGLGYSVSYHRDWKAQRLNERVWVLRHSELPDISIIWVPTGAGSHAELHAMAAQTFMESTAKGKNIVLRKVLTTPVTGANGLIALDTEIAGDTEAAGPFRYHYTTSRLAPDRMLSVISVRFINDATDGKDMGKSNVTFAWEVIGSARHTR